MTLEEAAPLVGRPFLVRTGEATSTVATLVLVEATGKPERPYRLEFEGPSALEQRVYWLSRDGEPPLPVFLVPIAPDRYEAVFN